MNDSLGLVFSSDSRSRLWFSQTCSRMAILLRSRWAIASLLSLWATLQTQPAAQAQFNSSQQVSHFVQSVLEIELARERALQNTQGITPIGTIPVFDCNLEAGTVTNAPGLPHEVLSHLHNFCRQSQIVLQQHNLSPAEFGQMRMIYKQNPQQYPQITQTFQQLCQSIPYSQLQICR